MNLILILDFIFIIKIDQPHIILLSSYALRPLISFLNLFFQNC